MKSILILIIVATAWHLTGCKEQQETSHALNIGKGRMPGLASDPAGNLYVVYGTGDSLMYACSVDNGKTFSLPTPIAIVHQLVASSMRGPQIAATNNGLTVIAVNKSGNIFSFTKNSASQWTPPVKINDIDMVAKEGFMALAADGNHAFAVWLDLRDTHNKIMGAKSTDAGSTWSKNMVVYASPDTTVCECCKPSVGMQGSEVYVMFRNHLHGNRDLYLSPSKDGGASFGAAQQLGNENWPLQGCPMDGGALVINENGTPETVWRRRNKIYTCQPGHPEESIGEGNGCTIELVNGKQVFAWTENGEVIIYTAGAKKINLGKGQLPQIKHNKNDDLLCVWEKDKNIQAALIHL